MTATGVRIVRVAIPVLMTDPGEEWTVAVSSWLLPVFLAAYWSEVEVVVFASEQINGRERRSSKCGKCCDLAQGDAQAVQFALREIAFAVFNELRHVFYSDTGRERQPSSNVTWKS